MMSYLTFIITECQTAQAVQIWYHFVRFNLIKKLNDEICVFIVPSSKLSQGDSKNFHPQTYGALKRGTDVRYDNI